MTAAAPALNRRRLGRELTRAGRASVAECLAESAAVPDSDALRIGFTGPPGAGKSTLIARLARTRLARPGRIGVLAVDPSSPISHGSILGDRVRMDEIAGHPRLYIRSVPSRNAHDGLADNIAEMLAVMERHGFDDLILETVGVGQADYTVRSLVDTVVLVVTPESGDAIQAMKAGIQEMADIYVVNKADRPGAQRTLADIRAVLQSRDPGPADWRPPVVAASIEDADLEALDRAIEAHLDWRRDRADGPERRRMRGRYQVESLLARRIAELFDATEKDLLDRPPAELYRDLLRRLAL